jgi:hypothetical protein
MSENTLNATLRRMGFKNEDMTSHGFRASASSMLNESGLWNADAIERQLAHVDGDSVRRAYARAEFWDERVQMMTWWADRCADMRRGGQVFLLAATAMRRRKASTQRAELSRRSFGCSELCWGK